ncbi:MAG: hypothetical protein U9N35_06160 [Euryarchaeota archaeon]|nr:hypothetical protein [Euryarchaeota archaeon]
MRKVDYLVIFLVGMCIVSFIYPYFSEHRFEGNVFTDVETALERTEELDREGFFYTLTIKGWWNSDNSKFTEEVFLIDHAKNEIAVIGKKRDIVSVGDLHNLKTDIRTSHVEINTLNDEVYTFEIDIDTDLDGLKERIDDHPIQEPINTAISGTIILKDFKELDHIEERKLNDELRKKFFYCKGIEIDEKKLHLNFFSAKYIEELKKVYDGTLEGNLTVYVRY